MFIKFTSLGGESIYIKDDSVIAATDLDIAGRSGHPVCIFYTLKGTFELEGSAQENLVKLGVQ